MHLVLKWEPKKSNFSTNSKLNLTKTCIINKLERQRDQNDHTLVVQFNQLVIHAQLVEQFLHLRAERTISLAVRRQNSSELQHTISYNHPIKNLFGWINNQQRKNKRKKANSKGWWDGNETWKRRRSWKRRSLWPWSSPYPSPPVPKIQPFFFL